MKRCMRIKLYIMVCLAAVAVMLSGNGMEAQAAEILATVHGTVQTGTNTGLLKLSTKEGYMEIKIDSGTDTSACKILLPDQKVSVSVSYGSDGYLHAVKISGEAQESAVTLDASTNAIVTGTIGEKTKGNLLYFNTPQGEMQIKLDATTNMSGCSILVADKTYNITCMRGSDAYLHAVSIADAAAVGNGAANIAGGAGAANIAGGTLSAANTAGIMSPSGASQLTPGSASQVNVPTISVTGTVADGTKENLLYLSTSGGEMQIVIDAGTDAKGGMMLTPERKLTVACYRGADAYMHAASIVGVKDSATAVELDTSSPATVTGTVGEKSTESLLYLSTSGGEMQLKLDAVRSINNCKVFVKGKKLTVSYVWGTDLYLHALDITAD